MAAIASVIAQRKVAEARKEKRAQKNDSVQFIQNVMARHDVKKSGGLTWEELKTFLHALHPTREDDITEGEMKWIIQMATPEKQEFTGEWTSGKMQLEGDALEVAAKEWLQYLKDYDEISSVFDKYDTQKQGFLSKADLTAVLQELNDDLPILEEDVDKVLEQASIVAQGKLSKPGFVKAISIWYTIEDERELRQQSMLADQKSSSACCAVS